MDSAVSVRKMPSDTIQTSGPSHPTSLIQTNVCPFEVGCRFSSWVTKETLTVLAEEGDTVSVAFKTSANDTLIPATMDMFIEHVGIVVVQKPIDGFKGGDTLYVLTYKGEGFFDVWYQGAIQMVYRFWDREGPSVDEGVLLSQVRMSWWVQVRTATGHSGWLRLLNTESQGFDFRERIEMRGPMWDAGHGA